MSGWGGCIQCIVYVVQWLRFGNRLFRLKFVCYVLLLA